MANTVELESDLFRVSEIVWCRKRHVPRIESMQKEEWHLNVLFKNGMDVSLPYDDIEKCDEDFKLIVREMERG